jgi:hypothetical protein
MATINASLPTLLDQMKLLDPNGAPAKVVEQLTKRNALLKDAVVIEGNLETGYQGTARTALPSVTWRRYNEGVSPSKSGKNQFTENCGMVEGFSVVDAAELEIAGSGPAFRASEDMSFLAALENEVETGAFYHSTKTAPEKFMGWAPRLDATSGNPAGSQIIKCDASAAGSDQTSIWLAAWSPETVFMMYPKNSKGGIVAHDMGEQLWDDGSGKKFRAFVTNWCWKIGMVVRDWRYLVRIANVDTGNLTATNDSIITAMVKAYHQLQDTKTGRLAYYVNRTVGTYLHLQALNNTKNSTLTIERIGGEPVTTFLGIPVRETDALLNTEAVVS